MIAYSKFYNVRFSIQNISVQFDNLHAPSLPFQ